MTIAPGAAQREILMLSLPPADESAAGSTRVAVAALGWLTSGGPEPLAGDMAAPVDFSSGGRGSPHAVRARTPVRGTARWTCAQLPRDPAQPAAGAAPPDAWCELGLRR
jgi:hypothetical protein